MPNAELAAPHLNLYTFHESPRNVVSVTMTSEKLIPLPQIAHDVITKQPLLKNILLEMAASDPRTFLHMVMTAECFDLLRRSYIRRVAHNTPSRELNRLNDYLEIQTLGALFHDKGKGLIKPYPDESAQIINSQPIHQNNLDRSQHVVKDGRSADEVKLHQIHNLTGAYGAITLEELVPLLPYHYLDVISRSTSSHHELTSPDEIGLTAGRKVTSYPRSYFRPNHPYDALAHLFLTLSDTAAATGQPRAYRDHRLHPDRISVYTGKIIKKHLRAYYSLTPEKENSITNSFNRMTMEALSVIQAKYPETICREFQGFIYSDKNLNQSSHGDFYLLSKIGQRIWNRDGKYYPRLNRELDD